MPIRLWRGAAGLDVCEGEAYVRPELLANDRVLMLPNIAASTHETRAAIEMLVMDNLAAFFSAGRVLTPPCQPRATEIKA